MSKIYLPTAEQMEETLDNLNKIAIALGSTTDTSSWRGIQSVVRSGLAPEMFPIGTQFLVSHSTYGNIVFDVVAYDYFKSKGNENGHTMTLMCHDIIDILQFDESEAFYYAESELPAGTYHFTIPSSQLDPGYGTYQFTLTKAVPKGGILEFFEDPLSVDSFASSTTDVLLESADATLGNGGTNLGTFGVELNTYLRCAYGSNNYKESAIRQFLNSSAEAGSVWTPQTKFDRPPVWASSKAGFLNGLNNDFLSVIGEVAVPCSGNNKYEAPDSTVAIGGKYTVTDKFYLASQKEIFGTDNDTVPDNSVLFPYYGDSALNDYCKYQNNVSSSWWTRTPRSWGAHISSTVGTTGELSNHHSITNLGIAPVCTIV